MRDLTPDERECLYTRHACPYCRCREFIPGPREGVMLCVTCPQCGAQFNVVMRRHQRRGFDLPPGQLLVAPWDRGNTNF